MEIKDIRDESCSEPYDRAVILLEDTNMNKICSICAGTMEKDKCKACGWQDKGVVITWMLIHMSILLYVVASLNGSLV